MILSVLVLLLRPTASIILLSGLGVGSLPRQLLGRQEALGSVPTQWALVVDNLPIFILDALKFCFGYCFILSEFIPFKTRYGSSTRGFRSFTN